MKLAKAVSDAARARELEVMGQRPKKRFGPKARLYRAAEAVSKRLPQIRPSPDQVRPGAAAHARSNRRSRFGETGEAGFRCGEAASRIYNIWITDISPQNPKMVVK